MTRIGFRLKTGRWPQQDDLERVNCPAVGQIGHVTCGWCAKHDAPMAQCLCAAIQQINSGVAPIRSVDRQEAQERS